MRFRFLSRALCLPCIAGSTGEGDLGDPTQQLNAQTQLPHRTREPEGSEELDPGKDSSKSTADNQMECIVITHIRATDVAIRLRRIPVGFYIAVKNENENVTKRTSNRPVSVGKDVVEWDDEIVFPADRSSRISLTVFASFELVLTLGDGEVLRAFETTVGELLDRNGQLDLIECFEQSDGEVISSPSSVEIKFERRVCGRNEYAATSNPPESEEIRRLEELTASGQRALIRYRELEEQQDLDESIRHFEHARDLCPLDHPSHGTVLFNLATTKLIYCRVNDVSPDLDMPINLYRAALGLRPRGHPDHPSTLLSLGIALEARFQRQQDEADRVEGRTLLSHVMDIAPADSYAYHAAVLALGSTAEHRLIPRTEDRQGIEDDLEDDGKVQRLDGVLQWIFYPDSSRPAFLDHLGILFCVRFERLGDLADRENAVSMMEVVVQSTSDSHPEKHSWLGDLGYSLLTRYERSGDVVDLERSISMFEDAVRLTPGGHSGKPTLLNNLAQSLSQRYICLGDLVDLAKSISMFDDLVKLTPDGHPDKPLWLNNLAHSLSQRYMRLGDLVDLEKSISIREDLVKSTPDGHLDKPLWLYNLGDSLSAHYKRFGDVTTLGKSILMFEDAVRFTPDGHPDKPSQLSNLAYSLSQRYMRFGDLVDLEKSISIREDLLKFTPDGHPDKPLRLNNLGNSLATRYERFGDAVDLEKSISLSEDAVQFTHDGHPDKPLRLNNLGDLLLTRYQHFGDVAYLEKSISMLEDAVQFTPDGHANKPLWLNNLARSLSERYTHSGDLVDLNKAILIREDLVEITPDDHPDKPLRLNNLGDSLFTRYQRFGDAIDLQKSISMLKSAVQFTPDDHPDKPLWLNNLGNTLATRYQRFGDLADLEESILMLEDVVQFTPDDHPDKPLRLYNLGDSLLTRYQRFGDIVDLEKSISMLEGAVQLTPEGHPNKPLWLDDLARSLLQRYMRFGDLVDLDKVVSTREDLMEITPDGHTDKPLRLNHLGKSLATRYECLGDVVDLKRSISLFEDAVQFTPDGHPDKPLRLSNLGNSLAIRHEHFRDVADLKKSISLFEDVVQFTPDDHPDKPLQLNNLGDLLLTRYQCFGDVADLEKSISMLEGAVQFTPDDHPNKLLRLNNLAQSLSERYMHSGDAVNLERSISMKENVVKSTPDDHPDKPSHLCSLANSLLDRFQCSGDSASSDLALAISHSSDAARSLTGPSLDRFRASQLWIHCLHLRRHDSQSLLDAYTVAVDLLPQLAWIGLSLHDRYRRLLQAADEACDAAATALEAHRPELAVEWLEQGRSIVWSQLSRLRTPVDDIRTVYPELAAQFERVSHELEHASARGRVAVNELTNHSDTMGGLLEKQARQHHTLAVSRETLLAEIRALPGFERFLLPKTIDHLSSLAHSGPVVFLNASKHRCDALVVKAGSERVVHVSLSNTSYDEVKGMQLQLNKLLRLNGRVVSRDASDRGARLHRMGPDDVFRTILPYLWKKVVSPILDVLALPTSGPKLPRIFWCPTGPFTFLPIHAAGIYDTTNQGPKLSDFVISSYIPTMSALKLPPQEDTKATSHSIRVLAVRQPNTDGQVHLTGVPREMEVIRELTASSPFVGLQEADGTVEGVLSKMTETDWVHFACHGTQDRTNPFDSGLLLADCRRLKLSDITQLSRPHGGLAFLSACHTATGDEQLSEEAIHIAAGMLLAGYRDVIATMWTIMDSDAPRVTQDVYKSLFRDCKIPDSGEAAEALHHAIERLRESGVSFLSWVPFIHVGV